METIDLEFACIHEAGHCIVAFKNGLAIKEVTTSNVDYLIPLESKKSGDPEIARAVYEVTLAGWAAEEVMRTQDTRNWDRLFDLSGPGGWRASKERVYRAAKDLERVGLKAEYLLDLVDSRALRNQGSSSTANLTLRGRDEVIDRYFGTKQKRRVLHWLASELRVRKRLSGPEVTKFLERARGSWTFKLTHRMRDLVYWILIPKLPEPFRSHS